jgi:hypothetical protein
LYNALESSDEVTRLYPEGHELSQLVHPTFNTIRRGLAGPWISCIWNDAGEDPTRAGFRPSYDDVYGPGSVNIMPAIACWLSSGPGSGSDGNTVALPSAIDRSIVQYAIDRGLLGDYEYVFGIADLKRRVGASGRSVYSIDDLGSDFDDHAVIGSVASEWLNSKDDLATISAYAPTEVVKDMYDVTIDDYRHVLGDGRRVYLKTNNTEAAGAGVFICNSEAEFEAQLNDIKVTQAHFGLNRSLVVQPELVGQNRNFQVFLDPKRPDCIQVIALTDQLVEDDGKTYKSSVNYPITADSMAIVGPVIVDMVARIRGRFPDAFGFLMCDFFQDGEKITIYDPGIRPTGNTATAMVQHFSRMLANCDLYVQNFHLDTRTPGYQFGEFCTRMGSLVEPENIAKEHRAVLPWGWNHVTGFGALIGVAPSQASWQEMVDTIQRSYTRTHNIRTA